MPYYDELLAYIRPDGEFHCERCDRTLSAQRNSDYYFDFITGHHFVFIAQNKKGWVCDACYTRADAERLGMQYEEPLVYSEQSKKLAGVLLATKKYNNEQDQAAAILSILKEEKLESNEEPIDSIPRKSQWGLIHL